MDRCHYCNNVIGDRGFKIEFYKMPNRVYCSRKCVDDSGDRELQSQREELREFEEEQTRIKREQTRIKREKERSEHYVNIKSLLKSDGLEAAKKYSRRQWLRFVYSSIILGAITFIGQELDNDLIRIPFGLGLAFSNIMIILHILDEKKLIRRARKELGV